MTAISLNRCRPWASPQVIGDVAAGNMVIAVSRNRCDAGDSEGILAAAKTGASRRNC